jgi:hypothetical protein
MYGAIAVVVGLAVFIRWKKIKVRDIFARVRRQKA